MQPSSTRPGEIYQLKVSLVGISPLIWRQLLVHSDSSIADLHHFIQIAMGWEDIHLHRFIIHAQEHQLVAGFALWVNLSGSLYLLQLSSTQAKVTQAFLAG
ncbi:plasmid pRiA4b ORF-3 family protein [Leptolyngbya sp. FACHB-711]|uniref:plasmid pRiA4b ORF-3 family protein n=1 Tax=Leptolyngbya sp. FACHB-711 TaxID=2692813 RepID=UPI0016870310|nr:plasmid pRiA4b ORF-3 family protein [Leptolyngbya sp. FACHB-711]MBD2027004.1 plasmid pRiA4b ORF-3 family protein [Leptolyngbya sp. FACHB-711]